MTDVYTVYTILAKLSVYIAEHEYGKITEDELVRKAKVTVGEAYGPDVAEEVAQVLRNEKNPGNAIAQIQAILFRKNST